jgi:hypothetical protein
MIQIPFDSNSKVESKERELLMAEQEWRRFNLQYPDEEACVKEVHKRHTGGAKIVCHKCGSEITSGVNERCFRCLTCHKRSWYTAGTPFVSFKKLKPWLFAQLLRQKGINVTGSQLADLLMISKTNGALIKRKVALLTDKRTAESGDANLPPALNSDNLIQFKEPRLNQNHLKDERRNSDEQLEANQRQEQNEHTAVDAAVKTKQTSVSSPQSQKEMENRLYSILTNEPQDFESMFAKLDFSVSSLNATLVMLELNGLATRLPGERYIRTEKAKEKTKNRSKIKGKNLESNKPDFIRIPTFMSLVSSLKTIWKGISKVVLKEIRQLTGGAR